MYATNDTDGSLTFRDDAGKHHVAPGDTIVITGDQHATAIRDAGLTVGDKPTTAAVARPRPAATSASVPSKRRRRKASVTVREE